MNWDPSHVRDITAVARSHRTMMLSLAICIALVPFVIASMMLYQRVGDASAWRPLTQGAVALTMGALLVDAIWSVGAMLGVARALGRRPLAIFGSTAFWTLNRQSRWALEAAGMPVGLLGLSKRRLGAFVLAQATAQIRLDNDRTRPVGFSMDRQIREPSTQQHAA